jgi:hypothetical protein|tara:strand:- start:9922 stop:10380 length:459 start_codon:yes stop_codon:yes gene_type:complete
MTKTFDFDTNFVSIESQEKGSEFEVINDAGQKTGMFICLAGPDSTKRKKTQARLKDFYLKSGIGQAKPEATNRKARRALATQGDRYTGETADLLYELRMDDLVAATISWRFPEGMSGPDCTPENAAALYHKHPTLFEQVGEAADDLDRFTKR